MSSEGHAAGPPRFEPRDPGFERRVRDSFARQALMATLGAELRAVRPGEVEVGMTFRPDLAQQHGYLHAAVVTALVDTACGYAALSLMPPGREVLSVEFKVNLLEPAAGERFVAVGRVLRPGRTLTVCAGELLGGTSSAPVRVAMMQATMIAVDAAR